MKNNGTDLVIVESPTKIKTLKRFLSGEYQVKATVGHIRDLPEKELGVAIGKTFEPVYTTIKGQGKVLKDLRDSVKKARNIFLAADPDREGEAICWHVRESLKIDEERLFRIMIYEITSSGIEKAFSNPVKIDENKVNAQQARRILDRLVGYKISPLLWKILRRGLSAGRVQTVALRVICEREKEIDDFIKEEYWTVDARLMPPEGPEFTARLEKISGKKASLEVKDQAGDLVDRLRNSPFTVAELEKKVVEKNPPPAYITSTLQQDASRKLRLSPKRTMWIAQKLYEGIELGKEGPVGLITYMRTDSVRLAGEAVEQCRNFIGKNIPDALPPKPRVYKGKSGAQDAHEAIRPTNAFMTPASLEKVLDRDQHRLYSLIWSRFIACQMKAKRTAVTRARISAEDCLFKAEGSTVLFKGFTEIYDPESKKEDDKQLPFLEEGMSLKLLELLPEQHFTKPPPRFTEAALIKELEAKGIGRPSTYAAILSTIQSRDYVERQKGKFFPTELGKTVTNLLVTSFPALFDTGFTAEMETKLDRVESGKEDWQTIIKSFYTPLEEQVEKVNSDSREIKKTLQVETEIACEQCGKMMVIKWGRHGKFLACPGFPACKFTKPLEEENRDGDPELTCPTCSSQMILKRSRYGRFYSCSKYPECKKTLPFFIGVDCPAEGCNGKMVEKKSAKGRQFYSCANYPECKFSTWDKPVKQQCAHCGFGILVERKSGLGCPQCKKKAE